MADERIPASRQAHGRQSTPSVLLVDDDATFADLLQEHLSRAGFSVLRAGDGLGALALLKEREVDAMMVDLQMPHMNGLELVEVLARQGRLPPTVVMSAFGSLENALQAVRLGAADFVAKPFRLAEAELKIRLVLERVQAKQPARTAQSREGRSVPDQHPGEAARGTWKAGPQLVHGMVGQSPIILQLFKQIERVARFGSTVLISGESGTGKELVARALHAGSPRAKAPFVAVNCAAIPDNLLESELFGHVKGAFTDAQADRKGLFEEAHGGTLFLDEIVEMPLTLQVKLLRVLQEGEVRRVGANKPVAVDVRVVAASAISVRQRVRQGLFREDLYYRLGVIELVVPPLRERRDDIPLLAERFVERSNARLGTQVRAIHPQALARLCAWHWPGNIRELQNCIEQACILTDGDTILPEALHLERGDSPGQGTAMGVPTTLSIPEAIEATEKTLIAAALQQTDGNRTHAAQLLAISPRNLQYKIKQYGIGAPAVLGRPKSERLPQG